MTWEDSLIKVIGGLTLRFSPRALQYCYIQWTRRHLISDALRRTYVLEGTGNFTLMASEWTNEKTVTWNGELKKLKKPWAIKNLTNTTYSGQTGLWKKLWKTGPKKWRTLVILSKGSPRLSYYLQFDIYFIKSKKLFQCLICKSVTRNVSDLRHYDAGGKPPVTRHAFGRHAFSWRLWFLKTTFHLTISMRGQRATGKIQRNNYHHGNCGSSLTGKTSLVS